jgi:hypothetical protein
MLPCGYSVCEKCLLGWMESASTDEDDMNDFDCKMCLDSHKMTTSSSTAPQSRLAHFPLNLFIVELCTRTPQLLTQTAELADKLNTLNLSYKELEHAYHASVDIIHGYCEQVRSDVSTSGEAYVSKIRKLMCDHLDHVDRYETECMANFEASRVKFEKRLVKLRQELDNFNLSNNESPKKPCGKYKYFLFFIFVL